MPDDKISDKADWLGYDPLLQSCTFGFGDDEDRNFRIGVFPEREKILICRSRFWGIALQYIRAGETEMCQRADWFVSHNPAMVEDLTGAPRRCLRAGGETVSFDSSRSTSARRILSRVECDESWSQVMQLYFRTIPRSER